MSTARRLATLQPRIQTLGRTEREPWQRSALTPKRKAGRWLQRERAALFAREPLCRACAKQGRTSVAMIRDHIVPLFEGGKDTDANIQPLCFACSDAKTQAESRRGRFGGDRTGKDLIGELLWPSLSPSAIPLTIVCGPAGAGKSTYCQDQATAADIVIDMDRIRADLGIGPDRWDSASLQRGLMRRNAMLAGLSSAMSGRAWFIVSAPETTEREWWQRALRPERIVVVLAAEKTCIKRIAETRTGDRALRAIRAATKWWAQYSPRYGEIEIRTDR